MRYVDEVQAYSPKLGGQGDGYVIGPTKTERIRRVPISAFLNYALAKHKEQQSQRIRSAKDYSNKSLVVADSKGNVPDLKYVRTYMRKLVARAGVHYIPPKNLRRTCISLMASLGIPMQVIQQIVGHASMSTTAEHYVRTFSEDIYLAANLLDKNLHENSKLTWTGSAALPSFAQVNP